MGVAEYGGGRPAMSAHLLIRDATLDDAEGMARIQVDGWNRAYASFIPDQLPASYDIGVRQAQWRERLAAPAPGTVHLVAAEARRRPRHRQRRPAAARRGDRRGRYR